MCVHIRYRYRDIAAVTNQTIWMAIYPTQKIIEENETFPLKRAAMMQWFP